MVKDLLAGTGVVRDTSSITGLGRSPAGGHVNPLQCSCLKIPMDRGARWATVHGVTKSRTRLKQLSMHSCGAGTRRRPLLYKLVAILFRSSRHLLSWLPGQLPRLSHGRGNFSGEVRQVGMFCEIKLHQVLAKNMFFSFLFLDALKETVYTCLKQNDYPVMIKIYKISHQRKKVPRNIY